MIIASGLVLALALWFSMEIVFLTVLMCAVQIGPDARNGEAKIRVHELARAAFLWAAFWTLRNWN